MISFEAVLTCIVEKPMQSEERTNNVLVNVKVIYFSLYPGGFAVKGWVCLLVLVSNSTGGMSIYLSVVNFM
jgi:hypothetical protein